MTWAKSKLTSFALNAPGLRVAGQMHDLGGVEEGLGRHAAAQNAKATHLFAAFEDHRPQTLGRGGARRGVTAAATAYDRQVVIELRSSRAHNGSMRQVFPAGKAGPSRRTSFENTGKTPGEYEENTKGIRSKYEDTAQAPGEQVARKGSVSGLRVALERPSPAGAFRLFARIGWPVPRHPHPKKPGESADDPSPALTGTLSPLDGETELWTFCGLKRKPTRRVARG